MVLKKLKVGSNLKFPVFIKKKLGFDAGSMVFFIGLGSSELDSQSSSSKKLDSFNIYTWLSLEVE